MLQSKLLPVQTDIEDISLAQEECFITITNPCSDFNL